MKEAEHRIWAEQDDVVSRLMIQIGDDKPVCVIEYKREIANEAASFTGIAIYGAVVERNNVTGIAINFDGTGGTKE